MPMSNASLGGVDSPKIENERAKENPTPDLRASIEFLEYWRPGGPWQLTALRPDKKGIETRMFETPGTVLEWLSKMVPNNNVYFTVNPLLRSLNKKAERGDVASLAWLHVDIDPRAGEPIDAERTRALKMLTDKPPEGVTARPSCVVFSGGGYQGFWRLEEPVPIDGKEDKYEDAKLYNMQLEYLYGADHCHNVDRIMRLPGTINWPDKKKAAKGRVPTLAEVVFMEPTTYPIAAFTKAKPVQLQGKEGFGAASGPGQRKANVSGNLARVQDLDELDKWNVPNRVKVIAAKGHHPGEPKSGDNSRSVWVFDFCCNMHRCGVPDEIIFSLLTDRDYAISESILEKGRNAERYALRQIERAKEFAISPHLMTLNEKHFVIENEGGKCRIAEWVPAAIHDREQLSLQSFEDFRNRYCHIAVETVGANGNATRLPLGKFWTTHPDRRQYRALTMRPGKGAIVDGCLNLWRGFAVEPASGEWSHLRTHIIEVLAAGDPAAAEYILRWAAWSLQHPDQPAEVALVFQGDEGTGKGTFARALVKLFGQHGLQVTSPSHFAGRFNAHLRDCCLLFADEAVRPDDKTAGSILKTLLTEPSLPSEAKGRDIVPVPNHVKVVMASNGAWVVPVGLGDRRFAVFRVSDARKGDYEYFTKLYEEIDDGGLAAMLHDLLAMDLGNWHPRRDIPDTDARNEQRAASLDCVERALLDCLRLGSLPEAKQVGGGSVFCATSAFRDYVAKIYRRDDVSPNQVAGALARLGWEKDRRGRPSGYIAPPLGAARKAWDETMFRVAWDETQCWDAQEGGPPF
jgi:hypothetical protein